MRGQLPWEGVDHAVRHMRTSYSVTGWFCFDLASEVFWPYLYQMACFRSKTDEYIRVDTRKRPYDWARCFRPCSRTFSSCSSPDDRPIRAIDQSRPSPFRLNRKGIWMLKKWRIWRALLAIVQFFPFSWSRWSIRKKKSNFYLSIIPQYMNFSRC